jgi:hypothetical protein
VRQLASGATTPAIREQLLDVAAQYERLAERVEAASMQQVEPATRGDAASSPAQAGGLYMATHRFAVGQLVRFTPDRIERDLSSAQRQFKIVRLLPEAASVFQYRVKSQLDGHERVVREDQLARA